jgi:hypothetical protein
MHIEKETRHLYFGTEGVTKLSVQFCPFHLTRKRGLQENFIRPTV